jgi:MFS family permease
MLALYSMMLIIAWQTYNLARETMGIQAASLRLGLIGLLQFVPLFLLTPVVGWVADHLDRRYIVRTVLIIQTLVAAFLAWQTEAGHMTLWMLYLVAVVLGVTRAFLGPATVALSANLIPKASIPTAIALSTIAWQAGMLVGPAMAGPLYALQKSLPYTISALLFALSATAFFCITPVPRPVMDRSRGPIAQISDGMAYVWTNKLVLGVITLDLFAVLLAGATALIPVFARDILNAGEFGLSMLAASPAAGAVLIAFIFSFRPIKTNVGNKMLWSVYAFGVATIVFGFSTWLPLSMAALVLCGAADMFSVYVRGSLIALNTPDEKRGRVSAVSQMTVSASNELGEAESGFLAGLVGPVIAVVAGGIGAILVTLAWSRLFPQIGNATSFEPPPDIDHRD